LALVGLATALTVGLALRGRRGWGDAHRFDRESPRVPGLAAGWSRGLVFLGLLAAWAAFAWLPILALSQPILERFSAGGTSTGLGRSVLAAVREPRWLEPVVWGAIVGTLAVASSFGLARWGAGRAGRVALWVGRWVPPLVLAVGLLGAGPILVGLSEWIGGLASLGKVGRLVDPYATSGTALLIGLTLLHLPRAVAATAAAKARCAPELVEAGVTLGASPRQARRDLQRPLTAPTRLRAGLLIGVLAAADFGLALPLVPVSRPSLPTVSVLDHFDQVGGRLPSAALGLAIAVVAAGAWIAGGPIERRPEP
jgi:ABC-type Fe3+ transport system permease subunit